MESARFPRGQTRLHESVGLKLRVRSDRLLGAGATTGLTISHPTPTTESTLGKTELDPENLESTSVGVTNGSIATKKVFNRRVPRLARTPMKRTCTTVSTGNIRKKPAVIIVDDSDDEGSGDDDNDDDDEDYA